MHHYHHHHQSNPTLFSAPRRLLFSSIPLYVSIYIYIYRWTLNYCNGLTISLDEQMNLRSIPSLDTETLGAMVSKEIIGSRRLISSDVPMCNDRIVPKEEFDEGDPFISSGPMMNLNSLDLRSILVLSSSCLCCASPIISHRSGD